jgi:putative acetyltransferase
MTEIREEQSRDIPQIRQVNTQAFGQPQEADLVDTLRSQCSDSLSLVAVIQEKVVGHIFFSPVSIQSSKQTVVGMGLAPMAVVPEYQRQGIGAELINTGIAKLSGKRCPFVVVLGHPEYYPRFGFKPARQCGIQSEWEVPDEAFMIVILNESEMQGITGMAKYRSEFAEAM